MLELIQENNVIIGIIIGIITLFITMRQIIISNQKHRMDKEDFISKKPNFSVYIENHIIPQNTHMLYFVL